jgi:tetratricopeptide (TPR) repeat protein
MNVIAVAGHPVHLEVACQAIRSAPDPRIIASLRSDHLIRTASGEPNEVETYHDRIRETVTEYLSAAEKQSCHRRLAVALEASCEADAEILCVHFKAAGDNEKAARHGLQAADRAANALAFDRAARLYRFVLGLGAFDPADEPDLQRKLADALANAGRGAEAAERYLAAAGQVAGIETLELKRLAAEQLIGTGRYHEGRRVLTEALSAVGLKVPKSVRQAILMALLDCVRLGLRGRRFRERAEAQVSREDLVRFDTCRSTAVMLSMTEGFTGAAILFRLDRLARSLGEPGRIGMAMALEAVARQQFAGRQTTTSMRLFKMGEALALRHENRYWLGFVKMIQGEAESFLGHWRRAIQICDEAEAMLRQNCTGVFFERSVITLDVITSLFFVGDMNELSRRIPEIIREAQQRHDLFAGVAPRTYFGNMVWLAADRVEEARQQVERAIAEWPQEPFLIQHMFHLIACASIDLYGGDGPDAWHRIARAWPDFKHGGYLQHPFVRTVVLHLRARAALASLGRGLDDRALIRRAERDARKILRKLRSWSWPLVRLVRAGIATARGQKEQAVEELETAVGEFDAWEMALYSAAAKRRLGQLIGGQRGEELITAGTEFMTRQGIVRPDRMTQMLAPGFE